MKSHNPRWGVRRVFNALMSTLGDAIWCDAVIERKLTFSIYFFWCCPYQSSSKSRPALYVQLSLRGNQSPLENERGLSLLQSLWTMCFHRRTRFVRSIIFLFGCSFVLHTSNDCKHLHLSGWLWATASFVEIFEIVALSEEETTLLIVDVIFAFVGRAVRQRQFPYSWPKHTLTSFELSTSHFSHFVLMPGLKTQRWLFLGLLGVSCGNQ